MLLCLVLAGCATVHRRESLPHKELETLYYSLLLKGSWDGERPNFGYAFYLRHAFDDERKMITLIGSSGHGDPPVLNVEIEEGWWEYARHLVIFNTSVDHGIWFLRGNRKSPPFFKYDPERSIPREEDIAVTVAAPVQNPGKPKLQKLQFLGTTRSPRIGKKGIYFIFRGEVKNEVNFSGAPVVSLDGYLFGQVDGKNMHDPTIYYVIPASYMFRTIHTFIDE